MEGHIKPEDFGNITPKFDSITPDFSVPLQQEKISDKFSIGDRVRIKGKENEGVYIIRDFVPETGHAILNMGAGIMEEKTVPVEGLVSYND